MPTIMASIITFWHQDDSHTFVFDYLPRGLPAKETGPYEKQLKKFTGKNVCLGSELDDKNCYCWGCGNEGTFLSGGKH